MNKFTYSLRLSFITDLSRITVVTVPKAQFDITDAEVKTAMTTIAGLGIVLTSAGLVVGLESAELVTTEFENIAL